MLEFILARFVRLIPALAVEITLSALILGSLFTTLPRIEYFTSREFYAYFLNVVGIVHLELPGVYAENIAPSGINGQLWTIPFEFECYLALVILSISTILKRRELFVGAVVLFAILLVWRKVAHPLEQDIQTHVDGRMLVVCFLAAVSIFLYRDRIPYSATWAALSAVASVILLPDPTMTFIAAFPIAYFTVWVGLMQPPRIPFGDLSYGVYLFHYPIEQTIMHLFPSINAWWQLTLVSLPVTAVFAWLSWNLWRGLLLAERSS